MTRSLAALAAASGLAVAPAPGRENRFDFVVSNVVSPGQPSATVEVWATWDADYYALAYGGFDVVGEADPGGFSDPERMIKGPGSKNGEVALDGDSVLGILAGQFIDQIAGIYPNTSNPILAWRATWSTADFTPRMVQVATDTSRFDVYRYEDKDGDGFIDGSFDSFLDGLVEGSGAIQVVPAPGSVTLLSLMGMGIAARRRPCADRKIAGEGAVSRG